MKARYLFPNKFKLMGWLLFIFALLGGLALLIFQLEPSFLDFRMFSLIDENLFSSSTYFTMTDNNLADEIISGMLIIGGILVAFSKERREDEFISKIRLESLVWAVYVNYAILLLSLFTVYGLSFYWVLVFNMFTVLLIFIIRFHWQLYHNNKIAADEK